MSSRKIVYSNDARIDLRDIARYSKRQWGQEQARAYMESLRSGIRHLGNFPEMGQVRPEYGEDMRYLPVQAHRMFYIVSPTTIEILRVVHMRTSDPFPELDPQR